MEIEEIVKRLEKLEKAVFGKRKETAKVVGDFSGVAGGVRLLRTKSFFAKRHTAPEVKAEMGKHGYHYSIAAVQTALNRASVKGAPLTALREKGLKVYVDRK